MAGRRARRQCGRTVHGRPPAADGRGVQGAGGATVAVDPFTARFTTPHGPVDATRHGEGVFTSGPGVPGAVIPLGRLPSLPALKRGIEARVGIASVRIRRPHYGVRRPDRTVLLDGPGVSWCSAFVAPGRWSLVRRRDGAAVVTVERGSHVLDPGASPAEVSLAVAVIRSRLVETSSLVAYLSL